MPSSGGIFDVDGRSRRVEELEAQAAQPDFWADRDQAQSVLRETKQNKRLIEAFGVQENQLADGQVLFELADEAQDEAAMLEAYELLARVKTAIEDLEFRRMLSGEFDAGGAVVQVNAGSGGVDAADWAQMLLRMIVRYCDRQKWKVEVLDEQPADEAGIKGATLVVTGDYPYGLLKAEVGVHRLVRISPFDANARRHTSFAAINVTPDVQEDVEVAIEDSDLRIDVFRAGGAGGQHVNKTESAVRITHIPTGIVVQCQNERSQHKNKSQAMRVLRSRLYELHMQEREAKAAEAAKDRKKIEWGSQIRSYVLAPYRLVTDHRTGLKVGDVEATLDGELDVFIRAYLLQEGSE